MIVDFAGAGAASHLVLAAVLVELHAHPHPGQPGVVGIEQILCRRDLGIECGQREAAAQIQDRVNSSEIGGALLRVSDVLG